MPHAHRHGLELAARAFDRHVRLQPSVDGEVVLVVQRLLRRREGDRQPHLFGGGREIERRGHDAGHGVVDAVPR